MHRKEIHVGVGVGVGVMVNIQAVVHVRGTGYKLCTMSSVEQHY